MKKAKKDNFSLEKPVLDLKIEDKKNMPEKIPDVFSDEEIDENKKKREEMLPLLKDVKIYLTINDLEQAKKTYLKIKKLYDSLSEEEKRKIFSQVEETYKKIKGHNTIGSKIKRIFKS